MGQRLQGTIKVSGAKNSAVALIPASLLANSPVTIEGLPEISDVLTLKEILEEVGAKVTFENGTMTIDPTNVVDMPSTKWQHQKTTCFLLFNGCPAWDDLTKAAIGLPGGCHLGPRPIDQHIKGFEALGASVTNEHGAIYLRAEELSRCENLFRCCKCRCNY